MGFFNPIIYFIKSFIRIFTKKFFWVILICVFLFLGFIIFSTESKAEVTIDNLHLLIKNKFCDYFDLDSSLFDNSTQWSYCITRGFDGNNFYVFGFKGGVNTQENNNFSPFNLTNYNLSLHINSSSVTEKLYFYYMELDNSFNVINQSSYERDASLQLSTTIDSFIDNYMDSSHIIDGTNEYKFKTTNLMFINEGYLSRYIANTYNNFEQRTEFQLAYTETLNSELSNSDYYVINSAMNYAIFDDTPNIQIFHLYIYKGNSDDISSATLVNDITLNIDSSYYNALTHNFDIPMSLIKDICYTYDSGNYFSTTALYYVSLYRQDLQNEWSYDKSTNTITGLDSNVPPQIVTTDEQLQTFNFDYFTINGNSVPYYNEISEGIGGYTDITIIYTYDGVSYNVPILDSYIIPDDYNNFVIQIPRNALTPNFNIENGKTFSYYVAIKPFYDTEYYLYTGQLVYDLSSEQVDSINADSEKYTQSQILAEQQKTNESINNLNNSITDSNVDNDNIDEFSNFGGDFNVTDETGIDQLFQMLYNAFCTDEVQDLTFVIPFVNKEVTINANNISNNFPESIKNIVSVFVWGFVGLWVLKDIRSIIDKISEGSPEDVGSDVKKEVL